MAFDKIVLKDLTGRTWEHPITEHTTIRSLKREVESTLGDSWNSCCSSDSDSGGDRIGLVWAGKQLQQGAPWWNGPIQGDDALLHHLNPGVRDGYPPIFVVQKVNPNCSCSSQATQAPMKT
eukprot:GFYU01004173.1.p1 GENE.GFYU01004173.1~~GFYU01004173.1.p1  ORF type:complete len:121 (-),score=10.68 GFYU01004173.1:429-791(-)